MNKKSKIKNINGFSIIDERILLFGKYVKYAI